MDLLAMWFSPGPMEMVIILAIALLLFGQRLPEVAKSLGKGLNEFQKGLRAVEDEIHSATYDVTTSSGSSSPASTAEEDSTEEYEDAIAPKFEPPPAASAEPDAVSTTDEPQSGEDASTASSSSNGTV